MHCILKYCLALMPIIVFVQWLSYVLLFATLWNATCQASLSLTISLSFFYLPMFEFNSPTIRKQCKRNEGWQLMDFAVKNIQGVVGMWHPTEVVAVTH